jgi:CobQ-like glutamine amidotransferase family enzyme
VLAQRLRWRGITADIHLVGVGDDIPKDTHLIIGGGGQDSGQSQIANDLAQKAPILHILAKQQVPMLMICGMYQMFGHYFKTYQGEKIPGIGVLDVHTVAGTGRLIGNVVSHTAWGELIGYENHSGLTYLGKQAKSFGTTKNKQGNNGVDKTEGAWQYNVFGSYLHGPLLAKSPEFADYLLSLALQSAGYKQEIIIINDDLAKLAASTAKKRPR